MAATVARRTACDCLSRASNGHTDDRDLPTVLAMQNASFSNILTAPATQQAVKQAAKQAAKQATDSGPSYVRQLFEKLGATDFQAQTAEFLLAAPLRILGIVIVAWLFGRVGAAVLRKAVATLRLRAPDRNRSARTEQRAKTLGDVVASSWRVIVLVVAILLIIGEVGINLGPLVAGAGIAGLAIAFGAQTLIKDYLSGLFILLEDQFGIGDVITFGTATGTVEDVSLRLTRIRSADGTVWFLPNGDIRQVGNLSMEWSRAIVDVTISYDNNLAIVLEALKNEVSALRSEPIWRDFILEDPEVQGVQSMGSDGVTIRIVVKTAPRQQWAVAREVRARVTERMRKDNVRGPGRTVMVSSNTLEGGTPPPPPEAFDDHQQDTH
jgi:moderate conductance mechanosensitive channel